MSTYPDLKLYIGGEWRKAADDIPVLNPATEEEIGRLPKAGRSDLDDALAAAEAGFRAWRRTAPRDRGGRGSLAILVSSARTSAVIGDPRTMRRPPRPRAMVDR